MGQLSSPAAGQATPGVQSGAALSRTATELNSQGSEGTPSLPRTEAEAAERLHFPVVSNFDFPPELFHNKDPMQSPMQEREQVRAPQLKGSDQPPSLSVVSPDASPRGFKNSEITD